MSELVGRLVGSPVELLTRHEREILAIPYQGHSASEITAQLTLAVTMVKWHAQQLYGQLSVNCKYQAINRAEPL